jgi:hypothetical protein
MPITSRTRGTGTSRRATLAPSRATTVIQVMSGGEPAEEWNASENQRHESPDWRSDEGSDERVADTFGPDVEFRADGATQAPTRNVATPSVNGRAVPGDVLRLSETPSPGERHAG